MKKIVFTGITILVALLLFAACDTGPANDESKVEYTDVVYSADGTEVTIYLDGVGVPVTKASRAMSKDIAKMSYDYLEVVFDAGTNGVARSKWELGQSAGISGVYRATDTNYDALSTLFVGTKRDKTLLGVGKLYQVDNNDGAGLTAGTTISLNTIAIKFEVMAITSKLTNAVNTSSFVFWGTDSTEADDNGSEYGTTTPPSPAPGLTTKIVSMSPLGVSTYPIYALPKKAGAETKARFTFGGAAADTTNGRQAMIKYDGAPADTTNFEVRVPRYLDGGRYFQLNANINTQTKPAIDYGASTFTAPLADASFNPVIPITFTTTGRGAFSFFIEIPVYALVKTVSSNGGGAYTQWFIRTGLGSELYSMDDGITPGGCITMSIGMTAVDWIDIYWTWTTATP